MIKEQVDEQIEEKTGEFGLLPNSISPVDYAIAEARKELKKRLEYFHFA
jgi:lipid II:glycine glycyltransferase (peptidoglycan interpeptide bridge formation enzyme)